MMISKYFLEACFKNPRNRTHMELVDIQELLDSWYDELEKDPDKLAYFILEVADRAYDDGLTQGKKLAWNLNAL